MGFKRARIKWPPLPTVAAAARTLGMAATLGLLASASAHASFSGTYALNQFTLTNTLNCSPNTNDGIAVPFNGTLGVLFTGSNSGSGCQATSDLTIASAGTGQVTFDWSFSTLDDPDFEFAGYLLDGVYTQFANQDGLTGNVSFGVSTGQIFGFRLIAADDQNEPGILTVTNFSAPALSSSGVPEPGTWSLVGAGLAAASWFGRRRKQAATALAFTVAMASAVQAQTSNHAGFAVTGIMQKTAVVNLRQLSGLPLSKASATTLPETLPLNQRIASALQSRGLTAGQPGLSYSATTPANTTTGTTVLPVGSNSSLLGFNGLTHKDQRETNGGNQFSIEPPNESIAVGNGFVLEGVNNAVRVFTTEGAALIPALSTNQVFSVAPAIIRGTPNVYGVYGTDMRVFYDQQMDRWFIIQRAQDNASNGTPLSSSRIYLAVSNTNDPTQTYTIYNINTTHNTGVDANFSCPCVSDYPQIGADQYGFYIATNEYVAPSGFTFASTSVMAISKASLLARVDTPTIVRFTIRNNTGYEFSLQPATTAPGAASFVASGGLEYLVSTTSQANGSQIALWAMTNTSSLGNSAPNVLMTRIQVPTLAYSVPNFSAFQKNGPIPLGTDTSVYPFPFSTPAPIDGGDSRVQSVVYSGGRLYITWATLTTDASLHSLTGTMYAILSPAYRTGALTARLLQQGQFQVANNHLLRPAWAVNNKGQGAIVFTLSGPNYYPSAAFVPVSLDSVGTQVQIVAPGNGPQDGFTGYDEGIARWGDYSTAVAAADGSIWMVGQYIPNLPRSLFANWGTYVFRYIP
jgi:hypothetical protein